ncbi:MAG: serine/threonine protein kinase [Myxococcota bacterium]|nr:serine/threonine protein kinase [Myxococcota bacterium]
MGSDPEVQRTARERADLLARWTSLGVDAQTLDLPAGASLRSEAIPVPAALPSDLRSAPVEIIRTIGQGGMGVVRLAVQRGLHREVAVKTVRDSSSARGRQSLLSEALVTAALQHPNIIPVYTIDEDESGAPIIVMKRIEGVSWHALLHGDAPLARDAADDPLAFHLDVLVQVAGAVEFAHRRGILHRDLKPENVMIGELGEVYLLDWGIAVSMRDDDRGRLPTVDDVVGIAGTPSYMAPEMTTGSGRDLGPFTDVFLLGATLHEVLTREPRHRGERLMEVIGQIAICAPAEYPSDVPAELASIANRATAREPAQRFPSADAFRSAIHGFLRHRSSSILAEEARRRVVQMQALVADAHDAVERQREIRDLFGAARFGLEQALEGWPENPIARAGIRDALVTFVRFEIAQRNLAAVESYLEAIEDPPADLVRDARALAGAAEAERLEMQRLRHTARQTDRTMGASARAAVGVLFGVSASGSLLLLDHGDAHGWAPLTPGSYLGWLVPLFAGTAVCFYLLRRYLAGSRVNRQILIGTIAACAGIGALRSIVVLSDVPLRLGFRLELIAYALALAMLAVVSNYRVLLAASICAVGGIVDAWLGRGDLSVVAGAVFFAFAGLSWAWASNRPPDAPPPTTHAP